MRLDAAMRAYVFLAAGIAAAAYYLAHCVAVWRAAMVALSAAPALTLALLSREARAYAVTMTLLLGVWVLAMAGVWR